MTGANERYCLSIQDLTKSFLRAGRGRGGYTTVKSLFLSMLGQRPQARPIERIQAIKELTLRIPRGSSVGIVGKNGSGKSTLLKLITGIYLPDTGSIECDGRVSALIELGAGFHPDFTGRENVYLGGMIQGLSRKQIDERFEKIVEFAELEDFIDEPIRTYSSGMFMRLGFSLAIHADPDILLVDEVLAVGDASFVTKCKARIQQLREAGVTLLLVTHDLSAVERWCDEALWLHEGEVRERGDPRRVIDAYRAFIEKEEEQALQAEEAERLGEGAVDPETFAEPEHRSQEEVQRWGSREVEITSVELIGPDGDEHQLFHPGDSLRIRIHYEFRESVPHDGLVFGIGIRRLDGLMIFGTNTDIDGVELPRLSDSGTIVCEIASLSMLEGEYFLDAAVHREDGYPYDYHKSVGRFVIRSTRERIGICELDLSWSSTTDVQEEIDAGKHSAVL